MAKEKQFKPLVYNCPICGERTTFGSHFCKGEKAAKPKPAFVELLKRIGIVLIGLVMIAALLWGTIG
jgi:Asp-tRNA(Asn)/Glu-tRNA(Gln) amidotransferase A subunit family amidase